jgi:predicted negative regulator of RcsB-dependent stress response
MRRSVELLNRWWREIGCMLVGGLILLLLLLLLLLHRGGHP